MQKVDPNFSMPSIEGELDLEKQKVWNSHLGRILVEGYQLVAYRLNKLTPLDGSEMITGDIDLGGFSIFNGDGDFDFLVGTTTNDEAAAGHIGEIITADLDPGSPNGLVTATAETIVSISLTAGDWDVVGNVGFSAGATTNWTFITQSISLVNNTTDTMNGRYSALIFPGGQVMGSGPGRMVFPAMATRILLASTTTVYLVAQANFSISTQAAYGRITARRAR